MKKIYMMLAALATVAAANAETVEWTVEDLGWTTKESNKVLTGETLTINSNLSLVFDYVGTDENGSQVTYRHVTADPVPFIQFYSNNTMTLTATDATITSVTFVVDDNTANPVLTGTAPSSTWRVTIDGTQYNAQSPTWTGSTSSLVVRDNSRAPLLGLTIEYTVTGEGGNENPGGGDEGDDQPAQKTELYFTEDMVGEGNAVSNISLAGNGVSIDFKGNPNSAKLVQGNGYFGTVDDYVTLPYKYQPNGTSSNGTSSTAMATCTFPADGTLTMYVYSSSETARSIQLIQNDETIFEQSLIATDAKSPEGKSISIYPVYNVEVGKGTAYILWPDGGLMFYGFVYTPADDENNGGDEGGEGEEDGPTGSVQAFEVEFVNGPAYDLTGRQVDDNYKGVVIQNGKKFIRR